MWGYMSEQQDVKVEYVELVEPLGITYRMYAFKCKYCGRVLYNINDPKPVEKNAKRHLDSHKVKYDSITIGWFDVET